MGTRPRDKEATKAILVEAVGKVLARDGFLRVGVNSVAREAGVDKVLIYRYFGGLTGLVREFSDSRKFWPGMEDIVGPDPQAFLAQPIHEMLSTGLINYARFIRNKPLSLAIIAWMLMESNELTRAFQDTRSGMFSGLMDKARSSQGPSEIDVGSLGNLLGAAVAFLALSMRFPENYHNELVDPKAWTDVENMIRVICSKVLCDGS
ncbi:MAG: TetR/AcrR family transcriptional regulator [Desulfovibrio sp.]|nr:MAG: TetR/AcrR family transcriptional regulator [Desulfovibrio sp.]